MYPSSSLLSGHMNAVSYPMYFIFTFDLVWKDGTGTTAGSTLSFLTLLQWFHPIISSAGAQLISQWFLWGAEHWENTCTPSHLLRHRPNPANISLREMKTKSQIKLKKKKPNNPTQIPIPDLLIKPILVRKLSSVCDTRIWNRVLCTLWLAWCFKKRTLATGL